MHVVGTPPASVPAAAGKQILEGFVQQKASRVHSARE